MDTAIDMTELTQLGLEPQVAARLCKIIPPQTQPNDAWQLLRVNQDFLQLSLSQQHTIFSYLHPNWPQQIESGIAWKPQPEEIKQSNMHSLMNELGIETIKGLHHLSVDNPEIFWQHMLQRLHIRFHTPPSQIGDLNHNIKSPSWLPGASFNIAENCFHAARDKIALIYPRGKSLVTMSYGELDDYSNQIANSLLKQNFHAGDAIGVAMTMNIEAVAIYLGIIKMGGVVISIADSFSPEEMATRLRIGQAKAVFTQDQISWGGKQIALYEKVLHTQIAKIIVIPQREKVSRDLREQDILWADFLVSNTTFRPVTCAPMQACHILFSSGTTGEPKAIVWNHTTPLKAASDAYLHHDIKPTDTIAWPTNLGWMMGPWLVFAALINQASIALYPDAPKGREFGEYISSARVSILGLVPTLVASWRESHCMEGLDWSHIKAFSSTGECSNPDDMFYLMALAHYKPIIEYCGGTEIGGAYISSTLLEPNCPSLFTTPTMGSNFEILGDDGSPSKEGEVAIIPPAIGLSTLLLNADHDKVYYQDMPYNAKGKLLRRHGDQIKQIRNAGFCILGRVDDTMNLGGIKTSAAEIERSIAGINGIIELAAIAVPPIHNGPSLLVIYAATKIVLDKSKIKAEIQSYINKKLNPLFRVYDVVLTDDLPKTASNKIMRRKLRAHYISTHLAKS